MPRGRPTALRNSSTARARLPQYCIPLFAPLHTLNRCPYRAPDDTIAQLPVTKRLLVALRGKLKTCVPLNPATQGAADYPSVNSDIPCNAISSSVKRGAAVIEVIFCLASQAARSFASVSRSQNYDSWNNQQSIIMRLKLAPCSLAR